MVAGAQHRHALALGLELLARLGAFGHLQLDLRAVDAVDPDLAAERRAHHGDRHAAIEVGAVALEEGMRLHRQENIQIARRPAAHARLALAREADAGAVLDAGRHIDRERALHRLAARARAGRAGIVDDLAAPLTGRAGALDGEEALLRAHAAMAGAGGAGLGLGALLRARAGAGLAGRGGRDFQRGGLAVIGLLERDLHIVAQVRTALAPAANGRAGP